MKAFPGPSACRCDRHAYRSSRPGKENQSGSGGPGRRRVNTTTCSPSTVRSTRTTGSVAASSSRRKVTAPPRRTRNGGGRRGGGGVGGGAPTPPTRPPPPPPPPPPPRGRGRPPPRLAAPPRPAERLRRRVGQDDAGRRGDDGQARHLAQVRPHDGLLARAVRRTARAAATRSRSPGYSFTTGADFGPRTGGPPS